LDNKSICKKAFFQKVALHKKKGMKIRPYHWLFQILRPHLR